MSRNLPSNKHIMITGGTGLIGKLLVASLLDNGYQVSLLSRKPNDDKRVKTYLWDVHKGQIDEDCLSGVDTVLHLAGEGIADKRWTDKRKAEILESRTKSIGLIYRLIKTKPNKINTIVSASATGYYSDRGDELMTEESPPATDFLGTCCVEWENAVDEGKALGLRVLKLRTGVVLHPDGGALPQMTKPVKIGFGAAFGNGKQWIPWIHWQDVVDMYLFGIENINLTGAYNMVAPEAVTNKQFIKAAAQRFHRPVWPINVPAFVFKMLMGEMSTIILGSTRVSSKKIEHEGFAFKYRGLPEALKAIYG